MTFPAAPERANLDRSAWLAAALDELHERGIHEVKIEGLARRLGVTKGSFYHHFTDRRELLAAMIDCWRSTQEGYVRWVSESGPTDPLERIHHLLDFIHGKDGRHDVGMRAWARTDRTARRAVESVDRRRIEYVESLMAGAGFAPEEARSRARFVYLFQVGEQTWSLQDPPDLRRRLYRLQAELLAPKSRDPR